MWINAEILTRPPRSACSCRYLPVLNVPALRAFGERVALNMPIQGTAADVIKLAMVHVDKRLRAEGMKAKLILQVHDELIVECPEAEREKGSSRYKRKQD